MLKIFAKLIVLPVMVILIALSFTVSILSKIHYLAAVLVNAIFIMCAVIALSLQQWQNFGIAVFVLTVSCMILKLWDIIEYAIGVICGHLFEILFDSFVSTCILLHFHSFIFFQLFCKY